MWKIVFRFCYQLLQCNLGAIKKTVDIRWFIGTIILRSEIGHHVDQNCTNESVKPEVEETEAGTSPWIRNGSRFDVREAVASFPGMLLSDIVKTRFVAKASDATRTCVLRLSTRVGSSSPCKEVRWSWISSAFPASAELGGTCTQPAPCPVCGTRPQRRPPAFAFTIVDSPNTVSSLQAAGTPQLAPLRASASVWPISYDFPNRLNRRPSSDTHFTHPKHRPSIRSLT